MLSRMRDLPSLRTPSMASRRIRSPLPIVILPSSSMMVTFPTSRTFVFITSPQVSAVRDPSTERADVITLRLNPMPGCPARQLLDQHDDGAASRRLEEPHGIHEALHEKQSPAAGLGEVLRQARIDVPGEIEAVAQIAHRD